MKGTSLGHLIPLPSGYETRFQFLGRYGKLEVFHFDPYSMALSKIERATAEDFSDVLSLLSSTLYKTEVCRVRTAHQPLKEQRSKSYIAPEVAGNFFNDQPKRPDNQNLPCFSLTLD